LAAAGMKRCCRHEALLSACSNAVGMKHCCRHEALLPA
jgi:hypothetical protein